jgi:hypothetical protein
MNVDQGKSTIEGDFSSVKVFTFAAPNGTVGSATGGTYTSGYGQYVQNKYLLQRGVNDCSMLPGTETTTGNANNPWNTCCYIPPAAATSAPNYNGEVDSARSQKGWRVILVHGFVGGSDSAYQPVDLTTYENGVKYAKSFNDVWIDTMLNVGSYWRGQNAFLAATATTSGSSTTYKWTLPPAFPPGKFLRITVPGGTVSQNGTTLAWDSHGYYEISLDVGSVTVGP